MDFESHWNEVKTKVYSHAYRLTGNRTEAEDLTQDTCIRAFNAFKSYDRERSFLGWCMRIATRLNIDRKRNLTRRVSTCSLEAFAEEHGVGFEVPVEDKPLEADALNLILTTCCEAVSERYRSLIPMLADEQDYPEISQALGIPIGTVRSRVHRIRHQLRKIA